MFFVFPYTILTVLKNRFFFSFSTGVDDIIDENRGKITSNSHSILENKFKTDDELGFRYCVLAFGQSPDGKLINCMYLLYKMDFVLARAKEQQSMLGYLRRWFSTKVDKLYEINESLNNFLRIKALRGLQKEGLIEEINFVDL